MNKVKYDIVTLKLLWLLFFLIAVWFINTLVPLYTYSPTYYHMQYVLRIIFIYYTMAAIFSLFIIKQGLAKIKSNDLAIAFTLGALGATTDIFVAVVTALTYIASMVMLSDSKTKIPFIKKPTGDILDAISTVLVIIIIYIIFYPEFRNVGYVTMAHTFYVVLHPAIVEEVIYRLFLFALAMKITKGEFSNIYHKIIIYFILTVPYSLAHVPRSYTGVGNPISYMDLLIFTQLMLRHSPLFTWFFLKRSLCAAILVHFFYNAYVFKISLYNLGNDILYRVPVYIIGELFNSGL